MVLAINVHALGYSAFRVYVFCLTKEANGIIFHHHVVYKWSIAGTIATDLADMKILAGVIGLAGADAIFFLSIPLIRQHCYHLFFYSHVIGFFAFMIGVSLSSPFRLETTQLTALI